MAKQTTTDPEMRKPDYHILRVYRTKNDPEPIMYVFGFGDEAAQEAWNNIKEQIEARLIHGATLRYGYEFRAVDVWKQAKMF